MTTDLRGALRGLLLVHRRALAWLRVLLTVLAVRRDMDRLHREAQDARRRAALRLLVSDPSLRRQLAERLSGSEGATDVLLDLVADVRDLEAARTERQEITSARQRAVDAAHRLN